MKNSAAKLILVTVMVLGYMAVPYSIFALGLPGSGPKIPVKMAATRPEEPHPKQDVHRKVLTGADFAHYRVDRGSGHEAVTFVIAINPKLPPYRFHLVPDLIASRTLEVPVRGVPVRHHVGRIEISKQGSPEILQTIEVESYALDVSWFIKYFEAQDTNFDGYLDIAALDEFGAKWHSYHYWLFDPASGRFITGDLTAELGKLRASSHQFESKSKTIRVQYLNLDEAVIGETYKIKDGHLVLVGVQERRRDKAGKFEMVTKRVIKGKMKIVKIEKE